MATPTATLKQEDCPMTIAKAARDLWLSPHANMAEVERLYLAVVNDDDDNKEDADHLMMEDGDDTTNPKKRAISDQSDPDIKISASEKLALLLCQSGRSKEASSILSSLGYTCRLSSIVLDYPSSATATATAAATPGTATPFATSRPCHVFDNFLTPQELKILQDIFLDQKASYWVDHSYQVEPPSPYFSYLIPLKEIDQFGFIGHVVQKVYQRMESLFPNLSKTTCIEMWAHNRPHASGHQFHFDSDNEGYGGVRNPIISTILYLTDGTGGPSLVTNQKLIHQQLASKGWMSHAKEKRLVAFDGRVLHGVVPGKGSSDASRRVTLMFAFWKKIKVRTDGSAARAFPTAAAAAWAEHLRRDETLESSSSPMVAVDPMELKPIYETLEGLPWTREMGFPEYEKVYQGF